MATVSGKAPLSFTDSFGAQRFVPLSAFQLSGSTITLVSTWSAVFTPADAVILLKLANDKITAGEFTAPPVVAPVPAITFAATVPGPEGNGIVVAVTPATGPVMTTPLTITATETDTYAGLADATTAANAIGVDVASSSSPHAGTGLVTVVSGSATGTGLAKDGQTLTVKAAGTVVLAADGSTTLFKLVPRAGYSGSGIPVTVNLDPGGATFTVTATYDAANATTVTATGLSALPASVAFLITAKAPPSGLALPGVAPGAPSNPIPVPLSGGAAGLAATGTVYTG